MEWKNKVKKDVSLQEALEKFDWCKINYDKKEHGFSNKRLDKLINNLKEKLSSSKNAEVTRTLKISIEGLEYERLGRNDQR